MEEQLINFELIKLTKEKGFKSSVSLVHINGDYYYLWMCELQKWLREEHSIDVLVDKGFLSNKYSYEVLYKNDMLDSEYIFKTLEKALEIGLYEALKLI